MNVLQHTRNELNLCLKENRPDRSYRDTLLTPLHELSLKLLTLKTVILCALASAERQEILSALDLNFRKESRDSISFVATDRLKTSRPGKSIKITFSSSGSASICQFAALKEYSSRSETLRDHSLFMG